MRTVGWRIIWKIIAVIDTTFAVAERNIWFSYIHNFVIILSRVYMKQFNITCSRLACYLNICRALHRYHKGQGFESRTSLNFFRPSFHNCKSCVFYCNDLLSYSAIINNIAFRMSFWLKINDTSFKYIGKYRYYSF